MQRFIEPQAGARPLPAPGGFSLPAEAEQPELSDHGPNRRSWT